MPLQDGGRCAMWSFDDRGSYAIASITASRKTANGYEKDFSHKWCLIVDKAYENMRGVQIADGDKVDVRIGYPYERTASNGHSYKQAPFSIGYLYDKQTDKSKMDVKIYNAEIVKRTERQEASPQEMPSPMPQDNPAPQPQAQPASNNMLQGTVGLEFLNVPDNMNTQLPFR